MPLENLLTLIKKLRERIDCHGDALRQSEALTRYTLIDPLLRELGWDTEDPDVVMPEYSSGSGRVDYALCKNGKSVIMLEAKKLDTPLNDAIGQGIQYCLVEGTGYFAVTDGRNWEIYETHKPVPIDDKRIVQFDLKDPSAADACLKALALWRPSVISGQVIGGETPVIGLSEKPGGNAEFFSFPEKKIEDRQTPLELIDINQAAAKELERLSWIGPQTAKRIVAYREENGPFKHIEDITKVEDIGIKTFEHLKSHITLSTL